MEFNIYNDFQFFIRITKIDIKQQLTFHCIYTVYILVIHVWQFRLVTMFFGGFFSVTYNELH